MNLYLLSQNVVDGYDTYDSCVVCAEDEKEARLIHPSSFVTHYDDKNWFGTYTKGGEYITEGDYCRTWVAREDVDQIEVTFLGVASEATKKGVILASFNAG